MHKYFMLFLEILFLPIFIVNLLISKIINKLGVFRLPLYRKLFFKFGLMYVNNHYYSPFFQIQKNNEIEIDNVDYNLNKQVKLLETFNFIEDFKSLSTDQSIFVKNNNFEYFDAEILYLLIRNLKPTRVVEVGGGYSTLISNKALLDNKISFIHECIEPYENSWLKKYKEITVIKKPVQSLNLDLFKSLNSGDLLLIDSSHMIKPGGDVLFEYSKILPSLKNGVIVGIHDIFLPFDYPTEWRNKYVRFWNEQYLLKTILQFSEDWKILLSLNYLSKSEITSLKNKFNFYKYKNPGSFYIKKD